MRFGLGGTKIAEFDDNSKLSKFLHQAIELGCDFVDTAPLYGMGQSETQLGLCANQFSTLKIGTKVGVVDLRSPFYQVKVISKLRQLTFTEKGSDWYNTFQPKNLILHLNSSLKRLQRESVDYFLLHSVPSELHLEPFAEALLHIKNLGMAKKIGISMDNQHLGDLSWCDVIELPLRGLNWNEFGRHQEIFVNSIIKESAMDLRANIQVLKHSNLNVVSLLGTSSIQHWKDFVDKFES
jgi:diketogulonate reductase-like aldo/keto reductase